MSLSTLGLTPVLQSYLLEQCHEHPVLKSLRQKTKTLGTVAKMQTAPEQAQFIGFLLTLMHAKKVLEIGTFTGYGSLSMALRIPEDGKVITCDINEDWTSIAKTFWQKAGVAQKITLELRPALTTLQHLIETDHENTFDFIFIDADKIGYKDYYEKALRLAKPNGLIAIDNTLWEGKVADSTINDEKTTHIRQLNTLIHQQKQLDACLIPIGDGMTLIRTSERK